MYPVSSIRCINWLTKSNADTEASLVFRAHSRASLVHELGHPLQICFLDGCVINEDRYNLKYDFSSNVSHYSIAKTYVLNFKLTDLKN